MTTDAQRKQKKIKTTAIKLIKKEGAAVMSYNDPNVKIFKIFMTVI